VQAIAAAQSLGIATGSTIYYDLEAFNATIASCRASSLWFLSSWTRKLHAGNYVSGVYSSALSGIKILDDARVTPGNRASLPDQIWIADWNGKADAGSAFVRADGWPGRRIHQYQGGHNETWGGVTINIDRNYLDLSAGTAVPPPPATTGDKLSDPKCTPDAISRTAYRDTARGTRPYLHLALQCLLKQQGLYARSVTGTWNAATTTGVKAWQTRVHHRVQKTFTRSDWTSLLAAGSSRTVVQTGVTGQDVVRAQRALNAAISPHLKVSGTYTRATRLAIGDYQRRVGISPTGVVATKTWAALLKGRR
jgi:hypothetical protein